MALPSSEKDGDGASASVVRPWGAVEGAVGAPTRRPIMPLVEPARARRVREPATLNADLSVVESRSSRKTFHLVPLSVTPPPRPPPPRTLLFVFSAIAIDRVSRPPPPIPERGSITERFQGVFGAAPLFSHPAGGVGERVRGGCRILRETGVPLDVGDGCWLGRDDGVSPRLLDRVLFHANRWQEPGIPMYRPVLLERSGMDKK